MIQGIGVARWAVWGWLCITSFIQRNHMNHKFVAMGCVALALAWTLLCTDLLARKPEMLVSPRIVIGELSLGFFLLVADGWVFKVGHSFHTGQNLAGNWPFIAVLFAATALGPWWGGGLAAIVGTGRFFGGLVNGVRDWKGDIIVSVVATIVFYSVAAVVWGFVTKRLRDVEHEVAMARARDEVARTLHDGVLQTLALVERRTHLSDPELATVARRSDRELRAWLFHGSASDDSENDNDLGIQLRKVADRVSQDFDLPISVSVVDDREHELRSALVAAISGSAGEALTNAAKHAETKRVVVFGEIDEEGEVFVSIRDDGKGFEVSAISDRRGIEHSIRRRMQEVGGRVEIVSEPNKGTEVRLWSK
jgi:hypothetical protein